MKKWLKISLWTVFAIVLITIIVFVKKAMDEKIVPAPQIIVHADAENAFLTNEELHEKLKRAGLLFSGQTREELKIEDIEKFISSISQVKKVEVFQSLDGSWKIDVDMRIPIARVFNKYGETFYIDDEGFIMDVSASHTARTLIISGEVKDKKLSVSVNEIINNDSLISIRKLDDIYRISRYVCNDPLFHSLIGQVHLDRSGDFVLIPLVGDQKIVFGSAYSDFEVEEKFKKLKIFYKEAMPYEGWDTYKEISLKFDGQIVCKKKNTNE